MYANLLGALAKYINTLSTSMERKNPVTVPFTSNTLRLRP
jgi:hypothetical protein